MKSKVVIAMMCLGIVFSIHAQDTYRSWDGSVSDDWMTSGNWQNDIIPTGADATARIWNSTNSTPSVPNNTVLYTGGVANLKNIWLGNSSDALQSGNLTVQSSASVITSDNMILDNSSKLTSSGSITVGNANGLIARDSSSVTLKDGSTLNKLNLQNSATATLEAGSSVTTIGSISHSSHLNLNNTHTENLTLNNDSTATINGTLTGNLAVNSTGGATVNGTLDGNFLLQSAAMNYVGAAGTVDGDVEVSTGDQITFAGALQGGVFSVNSTGKAIIESTADIVSDSGNSWLYNDADVTWNVGEDGSIGTLWTTLNESSAGANDGVWRYDGSENLTVVLDAYDFATYGTNISLRLVSGIQSESTFANNVTFLLDGEEVTTFVYDENGTFNGSVIPEPATIGMLGLGGLAVMLLRKLRIS